MRRDELGDVVLRHIDPDPDDGATLEQVAERLDVSEEDALWMLLDAGCDGLVFTNLGRWFPVPGAEEALLS